MNSNSTTKLYGKILIKNKEGKIYKQFLLIKDTCVFGRYFNNF